MPMNSKIKKGFNKQRNKGASKEQQNKKRR